MDTVKTSKGTLLPLVNLKGKNYLQVAYRLQWLTEDVDSYSIETNYLYLDENRSTAHAKVTIFDKSGKVARSASATKSETKADFSDHAEKAETGAIGRALAMLGFGTQHAIADLEEGERIVDSPLAATKTVRTTSAPVAASSTTASAPVASKGMFSKPSASTNVASTETVSAAPTNESASSGTASAKPSAFKRPSKFNTTNKGVF